MLRIPKLNLVVGTVLVVGIAQALSRLYRSEQLTDWEVSLLTLGTLLSALVPSKGSQFYRYERKPRKR